MLGSWWMVMGLEGRGIGGFLVHEVYGGLVS